MKAFSPAVYPQQSYIERFMLAQVGCAEAELHLIPNWNWTKAFTSSNAWMYTLPLWPSAQPSLLNHSLFNFFPQVEIVPHEDVLYTELRNGLSKWGVATVTLSGFFGISDRGFSPNLICSTEDARNLLRVKYMPSHYAFPSMSLSLV